MNLLEEIESSQVGRQVVLRFHPTLNESYLPRGSRGVIKRLVAIGPFSFEVYFPDLELTACCPTEGLDTVENTNPS